MVIAPDSLPIANMFLNAFPPEVLAKIIKASSSNSGLTAIRLWQCGNSVLNYKLQYGGCRVLKLIQTKHFDKPVPQLITKHTFQQLTSLQIHSCVALLPNTLHHLGPSLRYLDVQCANIDRVIEGLDYNTLWPSLTSLSVLYTPARINNSITDNFLPRLPSTITRLALPRISSCTLMDLLPLLSRDLIDFVYAPKEILDDILCGYQMNESLEQAIFKALPPSIKTFHVGWEIPWVLHSNANASLLPPQLTDLSFSYRKDTPLPLPLALCHLSVCTNDSDVLSADTWLKVPPTVTHLSFDHEYGQIVQAPTAFSPDQWYQFLPPKLVTFKHINTSLPLQWENMSRARCVWPATLESIQLCVTQSSHLSLLALPAGVRDVKLYLLDEVARKKPNVEFDGLVTNDVHDQLTSLWLNFMPSPTCVSQLPLSLNKVCVSQLELTSSHLDYDYQSLTALHTLSLPISMLQLLPDQQLILPTSLTTLTATSVNIRPKIEFTFDETQRLFYSLPSGLRHFECAQSCGFNLDASSIILLPQCLINLNILVKNVCNVMGLIERVPRSLQTLILLLDPLIPKHVDGSQLQPYLPPDLNCLLIRGCEFGKFDFTRPITSLKTVMIHVSRTVDNTHVAKQLFPNASVSYFTPLN